uniref:Uncharacterized protein n=1 Tax=Alexandrium monilatum TaxID=311494 RepID=A0A7S4QG84_9DINO|mmetsp:Transcript_5004/g.14871  ORF Transcript_5004/g.14871 Transcript_5004/m.14871 type:complete len:313 (+) Transcript_5004:91-1029(+)
MGSHLAAGILPECYTHDACKEAWSAECCHAADGNVQATSTCSSGHTAARWARNSKKIPAFSPAVVERIPHPNLLNQDLLLAAKEGDHLRVHVALLSGADLEVRRAWAERDEDFWEASGIYGDKWRSLGKEEALEVNEGLTPLMHASEAGHMKIVTLLLQAKACVNTEGQDGRRALHCAMAAGHFEVARALLSAGATCRPGDLGRHAMAEQLHWDKDGQDKAVPWPTFAQQQAPEPDEPLPHPDLLEESTEEDEEEDSSICETARMPTGARVAARSLHGGSPVPRLPMERLQSSSAAAAKDKCPAPSQKILKM